MQEIKSTCTSLSALLHAIKQKKDNEGAVVEDTLIADAMSLFAQLTGQHHTILQQQNAESEKCYKLKEACEVNQEVLDEQLAYVKYMDKEYDISPWQPQDGLVTVNSGDNHLTIKSKLDTELQGRRKMCEYGNTLEEEVVNLRKAEQETRVELERVRKVMLSMSPPSFLDGISPCTDLSTPATLPAPLFTLHHLLSAALRESKYSGVGISLETTDPLEGKPSLYTSTHRLEEELSALLAPVPCMVVIRVRNEHLVIRYHDQINVVSCDSNFRSSGDMLAGLCPGDAGTVAPHTSLSFTFKSPTISELVLQQHIGRLYCWLHELCGLDVVTETQRTPSLITPIKLLNYLLEL